MAALPERVPPQELRASDADRERVAAILRQALSEGRLGLDEVDERLALVYAARTYADLEPLTRDLPEQTLAAVGSAGPAVSRVGGVPTSKGALAVMSGFKRKGPWVVPRRFTCFAFWGGGEIDLRDARFASGIVTIRAFALMGGIEIVTPEDAEVHVAGTGIMGGFDHDASGAGVPGAPTIVIKGIAFMGGVDVKRRPPDGELKRRRLERKLERKREREERRQLED
jgi:hypothetical protein